jgi:hypothetical protein
MLITNKGQMVRTRVKEIRETGRNTIDVKLMDLRNSEKPFLSRDGFAVAERRRMILSLHPAFVRIAG